MKIKRILVLSIILAAALALSSCALELGGDDGHVHDYASWTTTSAPTCIAPGTQSRACKACGFAEYSQIPAKGHTAVTDAAIPATCLSEGKTAGSHCSECNAVIEAQQTVPPTDHISVPDIAVSPTCTTAGKTAGSHCSECNAVIEAQQTVPPTDHISVPDIAVSPTCTTAGKTEGSHCGVCSTVLVKQDEIPPLEHSFGTGEIIETASCIADGTKKYACTRPSCSYSYTEDYSLPTYTATELYEQSIKYVGEIVTYTKSGSELALGTGFVISTDGKIVTNYHVLEDAYYATICINGSTYDVTSVLAYDKKIDLAVIKINADNLCASKVCKNPVKVGETVYAIGSSRGLTNTYSQGIVTYADRVVDGVSHVQHDASITNGNSGGPLINSYGEVVGINAWLISNSQNLNFAIFTAELDNLVYGAPLSVAEFYEKECDVFQKMKNYIVSSGTFYPDSDCYVLELGVDYSSDYTSKYTRRAYYWLETEVISLDFIIDDGEYWVYFEIDENVDGKYYWAYFDYDDYEMSGTLYAETYDSYTLLGYSYNNIIYSSVRDSVRELASVMIDALCYEIDTDFACIGVCAEDLLFLYY